MWREHQHLSRSEPAAFALHRAADYIRGPLGVVTGQRLRDACIENHMTLGPRQYAAHFEPAQIAAALLYDQFKHGTLIG